MYILNPKHSGVLEGKFAGSTADVWKSAQPMWAIDIRTKNLVHRFDTDKDIKMWGLALHYAEMFLEGPWVVTREGRLLAQFLFNLYRPESVEKLPHHSATLEIGTVVDANALVLMGMRLESGFSAMRAGAVHIHSDTLVGTHYLSVDERGMYFDDIKRDFDTNKRLKYL